ncbi:MAG: hypothetical protein H8E41_01040 [Desulfobulbaceae bacterium]|uniref:Periplasmic heavy metal sensor n=1 Tax=Candidatus Desulfobia pelagia TaxID=2841692 RepID=A0A8J6TAJ8_9BACT|nr:hypothetical protein [Candidatus Desulfobia pelagia]
MKKNIPLLAVLTMIFLLSNTNLMAQQGSNSPSANGQQKMNSPFLITGKLPHLTKLLVREWDNPTLHLSEEQKAKLLVVRQETIAGVQKLGQEISSLEKQVTERAFTGETPDALHSLIQSIAGLKAEATMIHLRCIYDTSKILDQQQLDVLRKM